MSTYLFTGTALPERAQISLNLGMKFKHIQSNNTAVARVSIINNQIAVWIDSDDEWDLHTLRNIVKSMIQAELALIGYAHGYAYDFDIARAINVERSIDYVFGIDIPELSIGSDDIARDEVERVRPHTAGENGVHLRRCFNDLILAMKNADDTEFYCFRAIEALRHHCAAMHGISDKEKKIQWRKFHEICGSSEEEMKPLTGSSKKVRHGKVSSSDAENRMTTLKLTWDIVRKYLAAITPTEQTF